jgi:hypothetical protein
MARVALAVYAIPGLVVGYDVGKMMFKQGYQMAVESYRERSIFYALGELTFVACIGSLMCGAVGAAGWPLVLSMKRSAAKNKV